MELEGTKEVVFFQLLLRAESTRTPVPEEPPASLETLCRGLTMEQLLPLTKFFFLSLNLISSLLPRKLPCIFG